MIEGLSALRQTVLQSARAVGLAAGLLLLACAPDIGSAHAGSRLAKSAQPALQLSVTYETQELAHAQPLGRYGWRGGGRRFVMAGGGGWRGRGGYGRGGYGYGMMRPRAAALAWAVPAGEMRQMRQQQRGYQTVQYGGGGGGGGRWGWRGGRGGGGGGGRGGFQAPDAAARSLRNQGYSNVDPLTRRGRSYVGEATGPAGQRQRVIIDGNSGRVMGASPMGPPVAMPPPGAGWYGGY